MNTDQEAELKQTQPVQEGERDNKQQRWNDVALEAENLCDGLGLKVDEGIKETIIALFVLGFKTEQSCEGHLERANGAPWVDIGAEGTEGLEEQIQQAFELAQEAERAKKPEKELDELWDKAHALREEANRPVLEKAKEMLPILSEFYSDREVSLDRKLTIQHYGSCFRLESQGAFLQEIADEETKKQKLQEYRDEMKEFTSFLKDKYFAS